MSSIASGFRGRREQHRVRAAGQRRLAGGVAWIVIVAALLAGVVAVNVAVLQLNLGLDGVNESTLYTVAVGCPRDE